MARPIDADAVLDRYYAEFDRQDICDGSQDRDWLMRCIEEAPTLTQPNEPLTLEELREMDGEPVWFDTIKRWGIVIVRSAEVSVLTKSGEFDVTRLKFYRRPPEGESDA